ncbi:hypothetical protein MTR67_018771 [Solanum verrucosum]|uniref:Uncharacterized protein n=1 Tax=Solanum verrucosum TaxID=315347 RepID=A0AAF0TMP3_SOLVR|nr:hypothetical protein MTR67_018771 [Solanum verrucosum]
MSYNDEVIYNEDKNEEHDNDDEIHTMLEVVSGKSFVNFSEETTTDNNVCGNMSEKEAKRFDKLLEEAKCELYPECKKFSKLSFLVKLLHLNVYNEWSNKPFDMLLELLKEVLPTGETLPKSYYDAKNMLQGKDIDVYLRPLIDELKELWSDGVETFDAPIGKCFKMYAAVLWTINDFPAYVDMLSQLYRDDVDLVILDANVIELEAQKEHEVHYNKENSDQEDETMIEYISDHEENGCNNGTNDNEADTTSAGDDIGL